MHVSLLSLDERCQTCLQHQSFAFGSHCLATDKLNGRCALCIYHAVRTTGKTIPKINLDIEWGNEFVLKNSLKIHTFIP